MNVGHNKKEGTSQEESRSKKNQEEIVTLILLGALPAPSNYFPAGSSFSQSTRLMPSLKFNYKTINSI
ncbi:MAG TPA: hypothetical protein VN944_09565 [Nitrospiria bacterium]|nr:hypothetical protein [Nitrospiria bacterium]